MIQSSTHHADWQAQLTVGLHALQVTLSAEQQAGLVNYLALLERWNKAFNLTAIRDPQQMVSRQLLDSLAIMPWVTGPRVLDVGSGAGLPGIPLAIALPEQSFVLLDANGKKTRFIQQAITQLHLTNVSVVQSRIEAYRPATRFHTITARAFSQVSEIIRLTAPVLADSGQWALMLGPVDAASQASWEAFAMPYQLIPLQIPEEIAQRHLLQIKNIP